MKSFFVFDVESVGMHGEGFAVGGGVYLENGAAQWEFSESCPIESVLGKELDRQWAIKNIPATLVITKHSPEGVRSMFWKWWLKAKSEGALMATDCGFPVEARFLRDCIYDNYTDRKDDAPYPLIEISSVLFCAGMDPIGTYDREPSEMPKHDPTADARQSARILALALSRIGSLEYPHSSFRTTD